jgi:hypothetical protein
MLAHYWRVQPLIPEFQARPMRLTTECVQAIPFDRSHLQGGFCSFCQRIEGLALPASGNCSTI